MKRTELSVLLLILVIAAGFRLYGLAWTPPGLSTAEAINGTTALKALESGRFQVVYPAEQGRSREGLLINLQAIAISLFGNTAETLRTLSAVIGVFTVLGLYLLTKQLFNNWELAAMAATLMATGFWHVYFSRLGLVAVLLPLCAVWGLYYLWTALHSNRLWHWALAGLWFGIGFNASATFRFMPIVLGIAILSYLWALRDTFSHDRFVYSRHQLWGGIALMVGTMLIIIAPIVSQLVTNPHTLGQTLSWSSAATNLLELIHLILLPAAANPLGAPFIFWLVSALFAVGFIRTIWKIGRTMRTHGHPTVIQVVLFSWLVIGLLPAALMSSETPDLGQALLVAPVVYIMAAEGLWWLYSWLLHWYQQRETHYHQGIISATAAMVSLLFAIGIVGASHYFVDWTSNRTTQSLFNERAQAIADQLNDTPTATLKYVVMNDGPLQVQPIMFLTDTATPSRQKEHNLYYLTEDQFRRGQYSRGALVIQSNP